MGEETDGAVESLSKMQEKLKALTGVDILTDAGAYKDTYTILKEIGEVWADMSNMDQAAALELMAGKNRANTLAAILGNMQDLEGAYESALQAEGSALKENENQLASIQGRITLFNNALQTMWMNFINSDVIKFFVDLATAVIKFTDAIGVLPTAIGVFSAYKFAAKELKQIFDDTSVSTKQVRQELHEYITQQKQGTTATTEATAAKHAEAQADATETATSEASADANRRQADASREVQREKTKESEVLNKTAGADIKESATSVAQSGSKMATAFTKTTQVVGTLVKSLGKAALIMAAVKVASFVLSKAWDWIDNAHHSTEELLDEWSDLQTEIENVNDELKDTQSRIKELESKGTLSFVDKQELQQLRQTNDELQRRIDLLELDENSTANKARASVEDDYEKEFLKESVKTKRDANTVNNLEGIKTTLKDWRAIYGSVISENDLNLIKQYNSELYDLVQGKSYYQLDTQDLMQYSQYVDSLYADITKYSDDMIGDVHAETYIDQAIQRISELESEIYDANGRIRDNLDEEYVLSVTANIDELESGLASTATELYDYMDKYGGDSSDAFVQRLQAQIDKIYLQLHPDKFYAEKFDEIFGRHSDQQKELYELAQQGQLTADTLNSIKYDPLMNEMYKLGITAEDLVDHINALSELDIKKVVEPEFSISDYSDSIDKMQENISAYQSALSSLEEGTFTYSDFIDLTQQFPDLAKGVNTSTKSFNGLAKNLRRAIKSSPDELIDDLKSLREQLQKSGKSTVAIDQLIDSMENIPVDTIKDLGKEYTTLADKINSAKKAQTELQEAMSENPNEGYETRGEAMEAMKTLMSEGKIGSESELWSIAEKYGFTYDSAQDINDNADALAKFIAIREKWFKQDDDGNYTFDGVESFAEAVESAVNNNGELQKILKWSYDENAGVLDFDFDNENWDQIVQMLSEAEGLAGLTSDEFKDLLTQVGQFFELNWENIDDVNKHIENIAKGSGDAATKIDDMTISVESYVKKATGTDIDFDSLTEEGMDNLVDCDDSIKGLLKNYIKLRDEINTNPLSIKPDGDIEKDIIKPLKEAGLKVVETIDEVGQKQFTFDVIDLETLMRDNGYTTEGIMTVVNRIFGEGSDQSKLVEAREKIQNIKSASDETTESLDKLGISYSLVGTASGAIIRIDSNVDELLKKYQFTDAEISAMKAKWEANGIYINTQTDTSGVEDTQEQLNEIPENVTTTVVADTDEYTIKIQKAIDLADELSKSRTATITVNQVTGTTTSSGRQSTSVYSNNLRNQHNLVMANGTAHANGTWGAESDEDALVGELGPEILVRNGRWFTVGENGAEFTKVKRGDIIFNNKQSEQLLKNGYVTGRGKLHGGSAFASGTALADGNSSFSRYEFSGNGGYVEYDVNDNPIDQFGDAAAALSGAADDLSDAADEFREVFDWIEVRLEEINEKISLKNAQLENQIGYANQNAVVDNMIALNKTLRENLLAGSKKYDAYAQKLLTKVPQEYREAAQNGAIAIEEFVGEVDEKTLEAIQEYRDWVQKGADVTQQAEETITEISNLAKQAIDNIAQQFENEASLRENKEGQLESYNALLETTYGTEAVKVYEKLIELNKTNTEALKEQRDAMQAELNEQVALGHIKQYSQNWYDVVNDIAALDTEIIDLQADLNNLQDSINEIHWYYFDLLMSQFESISSEAENLIDILSSDDLVDDAGEWTKEGIASLGLYAQKMEVAEMQATKYADEIAYLQENWQKLGYTEEEYLNKLDELKDGQYDAIKSYNDTKDAIVDLHKERVDAIKEGIEKEIEALEELIEKKKEELDSEKDLYDFQKSVMEKEKDIADIKRQLAALSSDNSASARAKKAQLEAELAEAEADLQDTYYDRSVQNQQEALDKELENFKEEKDAEIEGWEEYLENTEQVVSDSLALVQENTRVVYETLQALGEEYSLSITDALVSPWTEGEYAIQSFSEQFGLSMSATVEELMALVQNFKDLMADIEESGSNAVNTVANNATNYTNATYQPPKQEQSNNNNNNNQKPQEKPIAVGGKINAGNAKIYEWAGGQGYKQYYSNDPIYVVLDEQNGYLKVRHHKSSSGVTGWFRKGDVKAYAKGSMGVEKDQWSLIDELGDELQLIPGKNGRLEYIKKGTGIITADLTERLVNLAMNPQAMLDRNRPSITPSNSIINNNMEIHIDASVAELVHVDHIDGNNLEDITKAIDKAWDKKMQGLNNSLRRFAR